jgi:hypothetical protein
VSAEGASVSAQALPAAEAGSKDDVMHLNAGAPPALAKAPATPTHLLGSPRRSLVNAEGASVYAQALPAAEAGSKDDVMHFDPPRERQ